MLDQRMPIGRMERRTDRRLVARLPRRPRSDPGINMRTILQAGYPRSGNTLLWKILSQIQLELGALRSFSADAGLRQIKEFYEKEKLIHSEDAHVDKFSIVDGALMYIYPNEDMRYVRVSPPLFLGASSLLFTHDVPTLFLRHPGFEAVDVRFYVCRDPRPVYVSLCHHSVRPAILKLLPSMKIKTIDEIMQRDDLTIRWAERWREHVRSFLTHRDEFHLVRYETFVSQKRETLREIVGIVGRDVAEQRREQIVDAVLGVTDFEVMQKASPGHVRKGGASEWTSEISTHARRIVEEIAGTEMRALGYLDGLG
jgi:Sulfotransferase domain